MEGVIGNTRLVKLTKASELAQADIYVKLEYMNPGGSVKDRAALFMVRKMEQERPGAPQHLVEGTAGNTGISLAHLCLARGHSLTVCVPPSTSEAKIRALERLRAEVVLGNEDAYDAPESGHFFALAERLAREKGYYLTDQYANDANYEAHFQGTGPEIYEELQGNVDAVALCMGTGATLAGVSCFLKEQSEDIRCFGVNAQSAGIMADAEQAYPVQLRLKTEADPKESSVLEGVGSRIVYPNLARAKLDGVIEVSDREALDMCLWLRDNEGFLVGGSSGLNVAGAMKVAALLREKQPKEGRHVIVTMLCDGGDRYPSIWS